MPYLNFPGKSVEWKKAALSDIVDQLGAGKISVQGGTADANATFTVQSSLEATKVKLLQDLAKEDPTGPWKDSLPTKTVRMIFGDRFP